MLKSKTNIGRSFSIAIPKAELSITFNFKERAFSKLNSEITKDDLTGLEKKLQTEVDSANSVIEETLKSKEAEIMKV